jgi:aspartate/methionine/tyrosine aminotransferase
MYSPDFNRNIDPMTEVMTAVGAYEALYNSLTAFINPGDEVITFLPGIDRDK